MLLERLNKKRNAEKNTNTVSAKSLERLSKQVSGGWAKTCFPNIVPN